MCLEPIVWMKLSLKNTTEKKYFIISVDLYLIFYNWLMGCHGFYDDSYRNLVVKKLTMGGPKNLKMDDHKEILCIENDTAKNLH